MWATLDRVEEPVWMSYSDVLWKSVWEHFHECAVGELVWATLGQLWWVWSGTTCYGRASVGYSWWSGRASEDELLCAVEEVVWATLGHCGGCAVEGGLLWNHVGGCAVEGPTLLRVGNKRLRLCLAFSPWSQARSFTLSAPIVKVCRQGIVFSAF